MDTSSVPPLKRCSKGEDCVHPNGCWQPATAEYFTRLSASSDGLDYRCRECNKKASANRYARARNDPSAWERERSMQRERNIRSYKRIRDDPQRWEVERQRLASYKRRVTRDPKLSEHRRAVDAKYRARIRTKRRLWNRMAESRRRSKHARVQGTFTAAEWERALAYFHGCCAVCGRPLNDLFNTHYAAQDHWIPLSKGGDTCATNIIPLCHGLNGCNNSKRHSDPSVWLSRRYKKQEADKILRRIDAYFAWVREQDT